MQIGIIHTIEEIEGSTSILTLVESGSRSEIPIPPPGCLENLSST